MQDLLAPFYRSGGYAVIFFFLLSGYVLSHAYLAPQRRSAFARNLFARFARMAPLHYATMILVGAIQVWFVAREGMPFVYQFNDGWNFVLNVLFLQQSGLQTGYSFNGPSWSISVEPQAGLSYQSPLVFAAFMTSSLAAASLGARGFEWPVYGLLTGRQLK